jgi:hypothetical protein
MWEIEEKREGNTMQHVTRQHRKTRRLANKCALEVIQAACDGGASLISNKYNGEGSVTRLSKDGRSLVVTVKPKVDKRKDK